MVLHSYVLALEVAGFVEALTERCSKGRIGRSGIDKSDHRHGRLLRIRPERPRGHRAAEQRDELASSEVQHGLPCQLTAAHDAAEAPQVLGVNLDRCSDHRVPSSGCMIVLAVCTPICRPMSWPTTVENR